VICFPNAGGNAAMFRPWLKIAPLDVELFAIQFPGRQKRIREPPLRDFGAAIKAMLPVVVPLTGPGTVYFGDCTGALFAYELIRALEAEQATGPGHLIASCCRAPDLPPRHPPLHRLDDTGLTEQIRALGFAPEWLLNDAPLLEGFLPLLRCDFELVEPYRHGADPPLGVPITVIAGAHDKITPLSDAAAWKAHTRDVFEFVEMEGDHDLPRTHPGEVMTLVLARTGTCHAD
jgi:medium-chain acyl-[acyl-carrier-protein] hydrolase